MRSSIRKKHENEHLILGFAITFDLKCDASIVSIGAPLMQERRPTMYFSEKLNEQQLATQHMNCTH